MASSKDYLLGLIRNGGPLTGGQQVKLCLMLSYPAILAQLSFVMMQYIDTSMVGHLGAAAGASIGLVSTCMWLLGGFCGACGSGFSVQVALLIGANDFNHARVVLRQGLLTALMFSGVISLIGMAIAGPLPHWLGGSPEIIPDSTKYFFIVAASLPFMQIDWMCASMLQVSGNMKVPSFLSIGMCVLDVCFNYLFIYVLGMGVVGAAIGTALAEMITAL
ncbi:MAG: polysaccharide biosynthesis C-terminal domain-containing protein, partial [Bacteroidales bacterium]|nr:polysaccharide biosynthesis C-terminal domain-containing protein [Bacteroidales bacterium]